MEQQAGGSAGACAGPRAFGFLTAVESATHGVFGGYLLVDPLGRPLEFHCTAPVKVSRAQQILFGSSLQPQLHGQQIGGALLAEGTIAPEVVLTDLESMLHVRSQTKLPVALVRNATSDAGMPSCGTSATDRSIAVGNANVIPHTLDAASLENLRTTLADLGAAVDLREPFDRIRAAIDEAQRH